MSVTEAVDKTGEQLIEGEQAYPIYSFSARWAEDGEHDPKYPRRHESLPDGRIWNSLHSYIMYREALSSKDLEQKARECWTKARDASGRSRIADKHPSDCVVTAVFLRYETWCGSWFGHWTFDCGQSDEEVLASFGRFVDRMELLGSDYCLMGAEDRWRWCGTQDGTLESRTDPPCRCKHCKERGVIRINH